MLLGILDGDDEFHGFVGEINLDVLDGLESVVDDIFNGGFALSIVSEGDSVKETVDELLSSDEPDGETSGVSEDLVSSGSSQIVHTGRASLEQVLGDLEVRQIGSVQDSLNSQIVHQIHLVAVISRGL